MRPSNPTILALNGGSSSIKFALFQIRTTLELHFKGSIESIGSQSALLHLKATAQPSAVCKKISIPNYRAAVEVLIDLIQTKIEGLSLSAIGHRVVHGGPKLSQPIEITRGVIDELKNLSLFDPKHMPEEILLIEAFSQRFPSLPQIACFDTCFHQDLPLVAKLLPIPRRFEAKGIRRYGFHGLSYEFLMGQLAEAASGRVILAHLGSGASLAAVLKGKCIDTSMSFTPSAGVPMSTRSGDLDPGLGWYLAKSEGYDAKRFSHMVNFESGLLGISETSGEMQELLKIEGEDERAAEAIALFCYQVKKWIGAFTAALGGLDTLVFSGGIGENAPAIRSRICEGLEYLGIEIEEISNKAGNAVISPNSSRVIVRVIETDEEAMIAKKVSLKMGFI